MKSHILVQKIFLYTANPITFTYLILTLLIQCRRRRFYVDTITVLFVKKKNACLFVSLWGVGICHKQIMDLTVLLELKEVLNSITTLSIWKPNTSIEFFRWHLWNIAQPNSRIQPKLRLKWWSFHCGSSICSFKGLHQPRPCHNNESFFYCLISL